MRGRAERYHAAADPVGEGWRIWDSLTGRLVARSFSTREQARTAADVLNDAWRRGAP